jgi:multisubunit Na+/H+ antiporter MnhB subunit
MAVVSAGTEHDARRVGPAQPTLGLLGLLLVVPIAVLFAVGAGPEGSTLVLAPLITYALPLVVMVAFWWADWPGTRWMPREPGWVDTALIAAGAVVLTGAGQIVVGRFDPLTIFDPSPGRGHVPTFPATLPLAGAAFVTMLQVTLVGEGWPLQRLHRLVAGPVAVLASWGIALVVYLTLVRVEPPAGSAVSARHGPVDAPDFGAALSLIAVWQVVPYVVWRGWPLSTIARRGRRLPVAHVVVLSGGVLSYLLLRSVVGLDAADVASVAGCFIASGLVFGMLFEDWALGRVDERRRRAALLLASTCLAAVLALALYAAAGTMHFSRTSGADWVEHASLNAVSTSIILHVAIGRRWPFVVARA